MTASWLNRLLQKHSRPVSRHGRKKFGQTRFLPNLCQVSLMSEAMGLSYNLRISAHALKSVEHRGGLDSFLLKAKSDELSAKCKKLKVSITKKVEALAAKAA